ncbi:MAG: PP2C family protein-serine/threonine phosphatase [Lachnospiraceae bacterium]|nr:PP2C family protein-serine/threonine phosphatase [Lachnospiraceae bacterium]
MIARLKMLDEQMKQRYEEDELFHANEIQANRMVMRVLFINVIILSLLFVAVELGFFPVSGAILPATVGALCIVLLLGLISRKVGQDAWWLKFLLLLGVLLVYARIDALLTHKVAILMVLPVLCSSRYFSRRLTVFMTALTAVVFLLSAIYGAYHGWVNMNDVMVTPGSSFTNTGVFLGSGIEQTLDRAKYARDTLIFSYIPKLFMFLIAAVISVHIADRGRRMVVAQKEMSEDSARMETELQMATQIQEGMLPNIYPPFPDRKEFDIYGTMNPAREVGGDFYDFFLIDDDHLAMVVADVSGKGVPAALFMMAAKIILANYAMMGKSPSEVLEATNLTVCSNNPQEMFVTVWLGILEISTGILTAANAGHEYPALKKNGRFELVKDRHGFVVGGIENVTYPQYTLQLEPGDMLFLYTDGVPEATNQALESFGTARMIDALNENPAASPRALLQNVHAAVDRFVGKAEQFDDLTMLCLSYGSTLPGNPR